ncbi:hypothetical protein [Microcella sp.]|uniref:hypothetical protein n=1 Tax=Microcella sp. TaxID=1913979 RepID=UPI00391947B2
MLEREIRELGGRDARMQIAIPPEQFRLDGYPRATAKPEHSGVILTLQSKHGPLSYPCDTFTTWQDNLRAIALALEALRKVDRYGVTKRGEQYRGFLALEATAARPFHDVDSAAKYLRDIAGDPSNPHIDLRTIARRAQALTHPDRGGDANRFQLVTEAIELLKRETSL